MQTGHLSYYATTIKAPIEKVWEALTTPELVKEYFFGSNLITSWKVGSPILFTGEYEGKPYCDNGQVLEYVVNHRLMFSYLSSWSGLPDHPDNYLIITYEVKAMDVGTELKITQTNYDEDKARHSEGNWAQVIDGLKKLVE
jgi:uncharacterized protein YndB with AHSA1/START domain